MKAENIKIQGVEFTIDGARHRLVYDINAMIDLAEKYGSFDKAIKGMLEEDEEEKDDKEIQNKPIVLPVMREVFWAGLRHDEPDITLQQAGALMDVKCLSDIYVYIVMAAIGALPDVGEEEPADPS